MLFYEEAETERKQGFDKAKASAVRDGIEWSVQVIVDIEDASELA